MVFGIVSDQFRPGNSELSQYSNFSNQLNANFSQLDRINAQLSNQSNNSILNQQLNFQLQNPLAEITNNSINARSFLNIDPVIFDLNNDGIKLTSYNNSEVTFDVDNDGLERRSSQPRFILARWAQKHAKCMFLVNSGHERSESQERKNWLGE